jgi:hypothetical protein
MAATVARLLYRYDEIVKRVHHTYLGVIPAGQMTDPLVVDFVEQDRDDAL